MTGTKLDDKSPIVDSKFIKIFGGPNYSCLDRIPTPTTEVNGRFLLNPEDEVPQEKIILANRNFAFIVNQRTCITRVDNYCNETLLAGQINKSALVDGKGETARFEFIVAMAFDNDGGHIIIIDRVSNPILHRDTLLIRKININPTDDNGYGSVNTLVALCIPKDFVLTGFTICERGIYYFTIGDHNLYMFDPRNLDEIVPKNMSLFNKMTVYARYPVGVFSPREGNNNRETGKMIFQKKDFWFNRAGHIAYCKYDNRLIVCDNDKIVSVYLDKDMVCILRNGFTIDNRPLIAIADQYGKIYYTKKNSPGSIFVMENNVYGYDDSFYDGVFENIKSLQIEYIPEHPFVKLIHVNDNHRSLEFMVMGMEGFELPMSLS